MPAVAWVDVPASEPSASSLEPCAVSRLKLGDSSGGGAMGTWIVPIRIENAGAACDLDLKAVNVEAEVQGKWKSEVGDTTSDSSADVPGNGELVIQATFDASCDALGDTAEPVPTRVTFGGQVFELNDANLPSNVEACGALGLVVVPAEDSQDLGTGDFSALRVTVVPPPDYASVTSLNYSVDIQNVSDKSFEFARPCPSYTESFFVGESKFSKTYSLNCNGVQIKAGGSVKFNMEIESPEGRATQLLWALDGGPSGSAEIN